MCGAIHCIHAISRKCHSVLGAVLSLHPLLRISLLLSLSVVAVTFDGVTSFARYRFDATLGQFGSEGRLSVRTRDMDSLLVHVGWQPIGRPDTNDFLSVDIVNRTAVLAADLGRGAYVGIMCMSCCSWSP